MFDWETIVRWLSIAGLFLNITGSIIIGYGTIITKGKAVEQGVAHLGDKDNEEENFDIPLVRALIKQSKNTCIGFFVLILGFILQLISSWPK